MLQYLYSVFETAFLGIMSHKFGVRLRQQVSRGHQFECFNVYIIDGSGTSSSLILSIPSYKILYLLD